MSIDEALYQQFEAGKASGLQLRFYSWSALAISFGQRQSLSLIDQEQAKALGISLVRRITGGGMVFHQPNELTYCLVSENTLFPESIILSCSLISQQLIAGLKLLGVEAVLAGRTGVDRCNDALCFTRPTKYEVLVNGKKLIGSAQKRGRRAFMQHGSLALQALDPLFSQLTDISPVQAQQISLQEILHKDLLYTDVATILSGAMELSKNATC